MRELRRLLRVRGISERELERRDPQLRRSTVGAGLRGGCGARLEVVTATVRVCGVDGEAARARADAWARLSRPDLEQRRARGEAYARSLWPLYRWDVAKLPDACRPCVVEIYIAGLIYVRLERGFPRWLVHTALTIVGAVVGWLAARFPGLFR